MAIRNFGIIAHIDAGKTTLTERILHESGALRVCGAVEEGNTVSDYLLQERERGISIISAALTCKWLGHQFNLIDTPGHVDFTAEVERSLRVMDAVIALICAVNGVQAQTEMVWKRARRYNLPALAFINKTDRQGADFESVVEQSKTLFGDKTPLLLVLPIHDVTDGALLGLLDVVNGNFLPAAHPEVIEDVTDSEQLTLLDVARSQLFEQLAEVDDEVMQCFISGIAPDMVLLKRAIRTAVASERVVPLFCGSAANGLGVRLLLNAVVDYLPSPEERLKSAMARKALGLSLDRFQRRNTSSINDRYAVGTVLKNVRGGWPCDYTALRLYSGTLLPGMVLRDANREIALTIGHIWRLNASEVEEIETAPAGDVIGISSADGESLPHFCAGDTLVEDGGPLIRLARMRFPEPVVSRKVWSEEEQSRDILPGAIRSLVEDDPTLRLRSEDDGTRFKLAGLGELHLEIALERLETEHGVRVKSSPPMVAYRSTVRKKSTVRNEFQRQLPGGLILQAVVKLELEPLPRGTGMEIALPFKNECVLPQQCIDAICSAIDEVVDSGSPSGYPMTDTRITVLEGSTTMATPSEPAFLTACRAALQQAWELSGQCVLEPVMRIEAGMPQSYVGAVRNDLNAREGQVLRIDPLPNGMARMVALVPLANLFSYASDLRSLTNGRGEFTAEPNSYEERHAPEQNTR